MDPADYERTLVTDDTTCRLPHPARCLVAEPQYLPMLQKLAGAKVWQKLARLMADADKLTVEIVRDITADPELALIARMADIGSDMPGGTEYGNAYANMLMLRHALAPQPLFRIENALCELLHQTDLDDDIPMSMLQSPFPRLYVEFGTARNIPIFVPNPQSGDHFIEGAYVESGVHPTEGPGLYVMLTGSPLGKRHALDDATHAVFLPRREEMSLKQALQWSYDTAAVNVAAANLIPSPESSMAPSLEGLVYLAKVLLYIGLPEARRSLHPEKTDWEKSTRLLKSTAKQQKAARRGRGLLDHVLISAPAPLAQGVGYEAEPGDSTVKPHWRRGHYRLQAHGEKLALRKLLFIRPLLVNAARLGEREQAHRPTYLVR